MEKQLKDGTLKMENTLYEDFKSTIPDCQRTWMRRAAMIMVTPLLPVLCTLEGLWDGIKRGFAEIRQMYSECW